MTYDDADSWMWEKAREILESADKLQRRFFQLKRPRNYRPTWEPPVDIFETDQSLWIVVALPGVEPASIELLLGEGLLAISGERAMPAPCRNARVLRLEIPYGRFERQVELPAGRFSLEGHEFVCGCLIVSLNKAL